MLTKQLVSRLTRSVRMLGIGSGIGHENASESEIEAESESETQFEIVTENGIETETESLCSLPGRRVPRLNLRPWPWARAS